MDSSTMNGYATELSQFETPFSDISAIKEKAGSPLGMEAMFSDLLNEVDSPFSRTYETSASAPAITLAGEEYVNLLAELNDVGFRESLYELANELEDSWRNKVSNELAMKENFYPFAVQQARDYFKPVIHELENMIDRVAEHFSGHDLAAHTPASVDQYFETLEFDHDTFSPAQEQFFGKIFNKVKSVVKKGVDLAKKGIAAVGKILPINLILGKLKGLVKPLLDRVLKFAIGKLPANLRPYAQTLAKKFLKMESPEGEDEAESSDELEAIQTEFDNRMAQMLFSPDEREAEGVMSEYQLAEEMQGVAGNYETDYSAKPSLELARQQFINELRSLQAGESAAPAIERFLPAVLLALQPIIKIALSIIGRQKVINFLAGLLAKLVGKYVPENVARPLAASIIDVGMSAIGFEVSETQKADLGYEAIANTIQETIQNMTGIDEAMLGDSESLAVQLLEAFEKAAADNFPPQYIKEEVRPTRQKAVWVNMPRALPVKLYKKFTQVFDITIFPQIASSVTTFRGLPLANFLRDKYGIDASKPVKARVHLYEILGNSRLSLISKYEQLPGLNARQAKAWIQLLPLTRQAATILLKEPGLGRDMDNKAIASRHHTKAGQRFYYLQIDGARLRIPPVHRSDHRHASNNPPLSSTESRSGDIQAVLNFIKSEIGLNYYFSEEDAKAIVEKVNKNDLLGAASTIKQAVKTVLNGMLMNNVMSKVKIIHESVPELYLENLGGDYEQFTLSGLGRMVGKGLMGGLIEKVTSQISESAFRSVVEFFKTRANEFKQAQAAPQDGVTIRLTWLNVRGMTAIRSIINAIRGNGSVGNLSQLALPSLSMPEIKIVAGKKFD